VSSAIANALPELVLKVRNRLWFSASMRLLSIALWPTALLLLGLGLIHLNLRPVAPLIATLALLPLLLAALFGLARLRPPLAAACSQADRWAGARSLLLSAWDLTHTPLSRQHAGPLVLERARRLVPEWRRAIEAAPKPGATGYPALALALITIGGFMLTVPVGARQPPVAVETKAPAQPANAGAALSTLVQSLRNTQPETVFDETSGTSGSKTAARYSPATEQRGQGKSGPPHIPDRLPADPGRPADAEAQSPATGLNQATAPLVATGLPGPGPDGAGDLAGGSRAPDQGQQPKQQAARLKTETLPLQRRPGAEAGDIGSGREAIPLLPAAVDRQTPRLTQAIGKAEAPPESFSRFDFGLSERSVIARYFHNLKSGEKK
jgi:hypothetical protein